MEERKNSRDLFLPTSKDEMKRLGWERADVILFSGDAYVDHPSFGTAVIARVLQSCGYKVAVVPQPNWRDDLRDFRKLGEPRLFFGVSAGAMDSMVNHYTSFKRLRSNDAYTPNGQPSFRPDYAVKEYSRILKKLYPHIPVVIGGIEASLRRFAHYDYWQDKILPSVLEWSGADFITYGMGEKATIAVAALFERRLEALGTESWRATTEKPFSIAENFNANSLRQLKQVAYLSDAKPDDVALADNTILLHSYEECLKDRYALIENFNQIELQANIASPKRLIEPCKGRYLYVNEPYPPLEQAELDAVYDLPYTMVPHPRYKGKSIPAYDMIKNSITIHRGCFGGCSFCTIAAHQGKFIQSRSRESILKEVERLKSLEGFAGIISDIGGPSANMYNMEGKDKTLCGKCLRKSCIFPAICKNLNISYNALLKLYKAVDSINGVRHSFVGSGVRYDLIFNEKGYINGSAKEYFTELVSKHISGRFKVAPEHTQEHILQLMNKPSFILFKRMKEEFERICRSYKLNQQIVPYFISSHPGCKLSDMKALSKEPELRGVYMEQVQSITPTPMTRSSIMYYTGLDPVTLKPLFVEKSIARQREQKSYFFKRGSFSL